jgi:Lrp/AsnC family transcriptional regulator, regulator for asnA, asnC and gidA
MKIDETNLAIIKHLRDGRKSFKKIANDLSITENTVRARITKLMDEGVLDIVGLVAPEALGNHSMVQIGIKLSTLDLVNKGEEFSKIKGVVSVSVVTGRFDLMATVLLNDQFNLLNFYTDEMSKIKEVESIETFVVYKSFNLKVPYIL